MGRRRLMVYYEDRILDLYKLSEQKDWPEIVGTSLARERRWGRLQTNSVSVARHSSNVASVIWHLTDDSELAYNALHHEIEEAFTGDLVYDIKHFLFPDKSYYNHFVNILAKQLGLTRIKDSFIKQVDIAVGMIEFEQFGIDFASANLYNRNDKRGVAELIEKIRPLVDVTPIDEAKDKADFLTLHYTYLQRMQSEELYE